MKMLKNNPEGLKAKLILLRLRHDLKSSPDANYRLLGTTEQPAEKVFNVNENAQKQPAGPKGQTHFVALAARLKSCLDATGSITERLKS